MSFRVLNYVPRSVTGIASTSVVSGVYSKLSGNGKRLDIAKRVHKIYVEEF